MIFQETKLVSQQSRTWISDPILQLLTVMTFLIIYNTLFSFPSLFQLPAVLPVFPGSTSQIKHLYYVTFWLKNCPWGESKLRHSSALCFSPSMQLPNVCSDPQNSFQRVVSVWHFQASSIFPDKSAYAWSILSAGLIFSVATSFISWFLSGLIAWRTLAWKDLFFTWPSYEEIFVYYRKVRSHSLISTSPRKKELQYSNKGQAFFNYS